MEDFGSFLSVQSWHICTGIVLGCWPVLVGSAQLGSGSSPFLVVGTVSLVRKAVLHLFTLGLQSGETPDLNPELVSLQSRYLWC